MSAWKPKIWKSEELWYCSYYRRTWAGAYYGLTPSQAYDSWKWRDELYQMVLKEWYPPLGAPM